MAGFGDLINKLKAGVRRVDDFLIPDTPGGGKTLSESIARSYKGITTPVAPVNSVARSYNNFVAPAIHGAYNTPLGIASIINPKIGSFYNQQTKAITKAVDPRYKVKLPFNMGEMSYGQVAGQVLGDPLTYVGGAGLAKNIGKVPLSTAIKASAKQLGKAGAISGALDPAESLAQRGLNTGLGAAGGIAFGGASPVLNRAVKPLDDVLRRTPFTTHARQTVDQIRSTPGLAQALFTEVRDNASKVGFMSDMKRTFGRLGLPEVYQSLNRSETTQVARFLAGVTDTIPNSLQKKIEKDLPKQSWGQLGKQAKAALGSESGFADTDLLTVGLASKARKRGLTKSIQEATNIESGVKSGVDASYTPKSNSDLLGEARGLLTEGVSFDIGKVKNADQKVAATIQEALNLQKRGDHQAAATLFNNLSESGTELGRGVQAFSLLQNMSPESIALSAAGKIKKYNQTAKTPIPELTGDQVKMISDKVAEADLLKGRDRNIALHEINQMISQMIPSKGVDKALSIWKAGLLTSLRTQERNFVGNTIHGLMETAKDLPAAATDAAMSVFTGKRSLTFTTKGKGQAVSKETRQQMKDIFSKGFDPTQELEKFDVRSITWGKSPVEQALKKYTDIVFRTLGVSDKPFYNAAMARSLHDQAGAAAINAGKRGDKAFIDDLVANPTEDMLKTAIGDANVATFKNRNAATSVSQALKRALGSTDAGRVVAEVTMPFTGVPSAVLGQTIAYSPVGLVKGIGRMGKLAMKSPKNIDDAAVSAAKKEIARLQDVQSSSHNELLTQAEQGALRKAQAVVSGASEDVTDLLAMQRKAAQEVGRGVMGTGVFALGAYLAAKGLITGQPKDQAEARQWELENKPRNSILIGNKWHSLNSIGPEAVVFLAGSKLALDGVGPEGSVADYAVGLGKDYLDQSFVQGLQGPVNAITDPARYAKSYAGNLLSSPIPNIVKDVAKAFDPLARETNTITDYAKAGIPGVRNTLTEKRDALGNTIKQEPGGVGAFVNLFNSKTANTDPVVTELGRLNAAGQNATPSKLKNTQSFNGEERKLSPKELNDLESGSGKITQQALSELIASPEYQAMNDVDKAKAVQQATEDARGFYKEGSTTTGTGSFNQNKELAKLSKKFQSLDSVKSTSALGKSRAASQMDRAINAVYTSLMDGDITEEQANTLFGSQGIDPKQAEYSFARSINDDEQAAYVVEALTRGDKVATLIKEKVLTANVAKILYESGEVNEMEYEGLKSLITPPKAKAKKGKKGKRITLPKINTKKYAGATKATGFNFKISTPKLKRLA